MKQASVQEIKKKSVTGAASYFARTILLNVIGIASALVLSKFLSAEEFGIYGIVIQIIAVLIFFSDIGFAAALIQKKHEPSREDFVTAFSVQQVLSWGIVAVILGLIWFDIVSGKIGKTGEWVLLALAVSFPLATLKTIPSVILERKLDFSKLIIPQIVEQLVFHSVLIYCAWSGYGVLSYAYAVILRSILGVVTMFFIQPWNIGIGIYRSSLLELLNFGAKFQANDLLARIKDNLFFLALGAFLPLQQFGYIQWAKTWSMYPYTLTVQNVMAITFPAFSRLQHDTQALKKAIEKSLFFISFAVFGLIAGMVSFVFPFISLFPDYAKWLPATTSLVFFTLSIALSAVSTPLTNTLNAIGHINATLKLMIFWTVITWIATPLLIYVFSYNGVSIAAFLISFTSFIPVLLVKKVIPFSFTDQVWRQAIAASVLGLIGYFGRDLWDTSLLWLTLGLVCAGSAYILITTLLGPQKVYREIRSLVNVVK